MSSIKLFILSACLTVITATPFQPEVCVDKSDSCKALKNFCNFSEQLQKACPITCNACHYFGITNPCSTNNGGCDQYCSGSLKAECSCRPGYQLAEDGKTCIDINECQQTSNLCSSTGLECVNTVGSYSCQQIDCENTLGASFRNYYKSDMCCQAPNDETQARKYSQKENSVSMPTGDAVQWPWMAQIINKDVQTCGATLISDKWLVTSSFCLSSGSYDKMKIFLGNIRSAYYPQSTKSSRVERTVKQVVTHPNFPSNDIALIEMNEAVEFNNLIQPVRFPCGETPSVGQICYVTGFGVKDEMKRALPVQNLKVIGLPIVSSAYCAIRYKNTNRAFNATTKLCAGFMNGGEDACYGDGGSPLVCQRADSCEWYLSGIVSSGKGCGRPGYPGIYTKVVEYESWIQNEINENLSAHCPQ